MKLNRILGRALWSCCLLCSFQAHATTIVVCKDENGRRVFSDRRSDCVRPDDARRIAFEESKPGAVNYRTPARTYKPIAGAFKVFVEADMALAEPALTRQATDKLQQTLAEIVEQLPAASRPAMRGLKYYLMWGEKSPKGGRASSMRYVRPGEPGNNPLHDPSWEHSIVVYSTTNWMYLDPLWSRKALLHEMAHAQHIAHWPDRHPLIVDAWRSAKDAGIYNNVKNRIGAVIPSAYAAANQMEYFAELSAIYFVGGDYTPFDRNGLRLHDPQGYNMVEKMWAVGR